MASFLAFSALGIGRRLALLPACSSVALLVLSHCTAPVNQVPVRALDVDAPLSDTTRASSSEQPQVATPLGAPRAPEPAGPVKHVIVVTIDGMMPETYLTPEAHELNVPNLVRMREQGTTSDGARSVWPTLTYPAHTSIASGTNPGKHGVLTNGAYDPLGRNQDGWRWYTSDVKVPRVWDVARAAGYRTAVIDWPATVGTDATLHVPEFWRAKVDEDLKLIAALSTPKDILQRVGAEYPNFSRGFRPQDVSDEAGTDLASYAIEHVRPHVLFLHVWQVDHAQHYHGLWSKEAIDAIENADRQLGRLLEAVDKAGLSHKTAIVVASDHGFTNITETYNPRALLRQAGLVSMDKTGKVTDWRATSMPTHGSAYVYLRDPNDEAVKAQTRRVFDEAARKYPKAIARILDHEAIVAKGGDPEAFLALAAPLGVTFGTSYDAWQSKPSLKATHGHDPDEPAMLASLLMYGVGVTPGKLQNARLIDIAPTVASWLGLSLPNAEGSVLISTPREVRTPPALPSAAPAHTAR